MEAESSIRSLWTRGSRKSMECLHTFLIGTSSKSSGLSSSKMLLVLVLGHDRVERTEPKGWLGQLGPELYPCLSCLCHLCFLFLRSVFLLHSCHLCSSTVLCMLKLRGQVAGGAGSACLFLPRPFLWVTENERCSEPSSVLRFLV